MDQNQMAEYEISKDSVEFIGYVEPDKKTEIKVETLKGFVGSVARRWARDFCTANFNMTDLCEEVIEHDIRLLASDNPEMAEHYKTEFVNTVKSYEKDIPKKLTRLLF